MKIILIGSALPESFYGGDVERDDLVLPTTMSVCTSTPTLTQFETAISTSFSVTESNSLTTIPAQLATNTATSCLDVETSLNATFCASSTEIVSISTIHGKLAVPCTLRLRLIFR